MVESGKVGCFLAVSVVPFHSGAGFSIQIENVTRINLEDRLCSCYIDVCG